MHEGKVNTDPVTLTRKVAVPPARNCRSDGNPTGGQNHGLLP